MRKKVFYKDFLAGKKRCTTGDITVKKEPWLGELLINVVYVSRPGGTTVIPEWCLEGESRNLIAEKGC